MEWRDADKTRTRYPAPPIAGGVDGMDEKKEPAANSGLLVTEESGAEVDYFAPAFTFRRQACSSGSV